MKLSDAKIAMLRSIRDHGYCFHHVRGNSQFGGAGQTMDSLRRAGLITVGKSDTLTAAGAAELEAQEARFKK